MSGPKNFTFTLKWSIFMWLLYRGFLILENWGTTVYSIFETSACRLIHFIYLILSYLLAVGSGCCCCIDLFYTFDLIYLLAVGPGCCCVDSFYIHLILSYLLAVDSGCCCYCCCCCIDSFYIFDLILYLSCWPRLLLR